MIYFTCFKMKILRINLFSNIKEFNLTVYFFQVTVTEKVKKIF